VTLIPATIPNMIDPKHVFGKAIGERTKTNQAKAAIWVPSNPE
jgi:hypothetical protein